MADTTSRIAGISFLRVDGQVFDLVEAPKWSVNKVKRETMTGMDRVHGYKEVPVAGYISATLRDSGGLTVADFEAQTNVTVQIQLANGKRVTARNAWTVDAQEVDSGEGKFEVKWESRSVFEE